MKVCVDILQRTLTTTFIAMLYFLGKYIQAASMSFHYKVGSQKSELGIN